MLRMLTITGGLLTSVPATAGMDALHSLELANLVTARATKHQDRMAIAAKRQTASTLEDDLEKREKEDRFIFA